ncbi:bis(5'-nucleosyl)-tetraphosphatase [Nanoarchaeota archaeon]
MMTEKIKEPTPQQKKNKVSKLKKDFNKRYGKKEEARYALSCGAIIFRFDKGVPYYLLLKYPTKSKYWGFVKGNVEPGETEEETLNREAAEEAGLYDIKMIPRFRETQHYFYRYEGKLIRKDAVYFLAKTYDWKVKISHEHLDYKWATYDEALEIMKIPSSRNLITKAHLFIQRNLPQLQLF